MQISTYLNFKGECETAFKFYEQCLGGKIQMLMKYGESPLSGEVPSDWSDKIIHASLEIADNILMGADAPPDRYQSPRSFSVSIGIKDLSKAEQIFQALAEGGSVTMPFQKTFWSAGFGMVIDRFGIPWMVNCQQPA